MRIGVISDTHVPISSKDIPRKVLEEFKKADMVIHAGDLVELSVLEKLKEVCGNVKAVCGNMDSHEVKRILPEKDLFEIGNFKIGLIHGYGAPDKLVQRMNEVFKKDKVNLIIFGHSHSPLCIKENGIIFFNPGSPTDSVFAPYNSFGIIEINDKIEAKIIKL
jgi:hypothetical protein